MIGHRIQEGRLHSDASKISVIVIVEMLSILSCIDIFCFPFCRITCNNYFGKSKNDQNETQTYRQFIGRSIDQSEYNMPTLSHNDYHHEEEKQAVL